MLGTPEQYANYGYGPNHPSHAHARAAVQVPYNPQTPYGIPPRGPVASGPPPIYPFLPPTFPPYPPNQASPLGPPLKRQRYDGLQPPAALPPLPANQGGRGRSMAHQVPSRPPTNPFPPPYTGPTPHPPPFVNRPSAPLPPAPSTLPRPPIPYNPAANAMPPNIPQRRSGGRIPLPMRGPPPRNARSTSRTAPMQSKAPNMNRYGPSNNHRNRGNHGNRGHGRYNRNANRHGDSHTSRSRNSGVNDRYGSSNGMVNRKNAVLQ